MPSLTVIYPESKMKFDCFLFNILGFKSKVLLEIANKFVEISAFYSTKKNWDSCHYLGELKNDITPYRNKTIDALLGKCNLDTTKRLLRSMCDISRTLSAILVVLAEDSVIKRNLDELTENVRFIQISCLQRMAQSSPRKTPHVIPFGKSRLIFSTVLCVG